MRWGFFFGVAGEVRALRGALELLGDCDRVVSLGDALTAPGPGDAGCLALMSSLPASKVRFLAGTGERARVRDLLLTQEMRTLLRDLAPAMTEDGLAVLGPAGQSPRSSRAVMNAAGEAPRLVAPVTVAASPGGFRIWRAAGGGLARVEELQPRVLSLPGSRAEKVRVEVGPAFGSERALRCVTFDSEAWTVELRERRSMQRARRRAEPEVRPAEPAGVGEQLRLAV